MIRIALAKGRLFDPAVACFAKAGIVVDPDPGRRLLLSSSQPGIEFLAVKPRMSPSMSSRERRISE